MEIGQRVASYIQPQQRRKTSVAALNPNAVVSITYDVGNDALLMTTETDHGLQIDDVIIITDNSVGDYNNVALTVIATTDSTASLQGTAYTEDGTGGFWAYQ